MPDPAFSADQIRALCRAVLQAGYNAMRYYGTSRATQKADKSPVTLADKEGEDIIVRHLRTIAPDIQIIGEEASSAGLPPKLASRFFLLDPLDGTKEFLQKRKDFTVNLGLIADGQPVFGIIYAPARYELFYTANGKAWWIDNIKPSQDFASQQPKNICMRPPPHNGLTLVASRSHAGDELTQMQARYTITHSVTAGSSLKFCLLALGQADLYPRFGPTMEWDIAAGHAILNAAGGEVIQQDNQAFYYGKLGQGLRNSAFIAKHTQLAYQP